VLFHRQAEQVLYHQQNNKSLKGKQMRWWDLSLIGIGAVIGAGYFLGTALSIQKAGFSVLLIYLLGGFTGFIVISALAEMSIYDPQEGSFRVYARKAFGPSMGFTSGWMYWLAGVLIMSSEVTALSIFSRYWFPDIKLWIFTVIYALLGLCINLLGVKDFGKIESIFGIVKTSALIIFIMIGILYVLGLLHPAAIHSNYHLPVSGAWFQHGFIGTWSAMIFVLFSYGGMEVMGIVSSQLKNHWEIGRAVRVMALSLILIYTMALLFALLMVPLHLINQGESPFVTALSAVGLTFADSLLNLLIISAAFSTMVGALFAVTNVMVSLANDQDAPQILSQRNARGVPLYALSLTAAGLGIAVFLSFLLPQTLYEYLTTAAGVILILNWFIILGSQLKNHITYMAHQEKNGFSLPAFPYSSYAAMAVIIITIAGAMLNANERVGVIISLGFVLLIFIISHIRLSKNRVPH
jgi:L-asparagine transporter-like permease